MYSISTLGLGTAALFALGGGTAFTLRQAAGAFHSDSVTPSSFSAMIRGAVTALPDGEARFGLVNGGAGAPQVFSLTLGTSDGEGSIVFSGPAGAPLRQGSYPVSDDGRPGAVRALILTGAPERPTGAFRAREGTLTVTQATDSSLSGRFELHASGFLADAPADESRTVTVTGTFAAIR